MRRSFALAMFAAALAGCGQEAPPAAQNSVETPGVEMAPQGTGDAGLANAAAQAEAEDAAIGGNVTAEDVSAAANVTLNAQ